MLHSGQPAFRLILSISKKKFGFIATAQLYTFEGKVYD